MSENLFPIMMPLLFSLVLIVLLVGLLQWSKNKGGNSSQKFMRARIIAQAIVIVVAMTLLYFYGKS